MNALVRPRLVRQKETYGCVTACIAMVRGCSYEEVAADLGPPDRGFTHDVWQAYLNEYGFATQLVYRHDCVARQNRSPWPIAPWANMHLCSVDAGRGMGSHLVLVLHDGAVLDPARDAPARMEDYSGYAYMAAVFPVGCAPAVGHRAAA